MERHMKRKWTRVHLHCHHSISYTLSLQAITFPFAFKFKRHHRLPQMPRYFNAVTFTVGLPHCKGSTPWGWEAQCSRRWLFSALHSADALRPCQKEFCSLLICCLYFLPKQKMWKKESSAKEYTKLTKQVLLSPQEGSTPVQPWSWDLYFHLHSSLKSKSQLCSENITSLLYFYFFLLFYATKI